MTECFFMQLGFALLYFLITFHIVLSCFSFVNKTMIAQNKINGSFVSLFPSEVLDVIFNRLPFRECIKCTSVCQSWNAFLFSWPGLWFEISDQCCNFGKDMKAYEKSLPWDHVQRLSIKASSLDYLSRHLPKNVHTGTKGRCAWRSKQ